MTKNVRFLATLHFILIFFFQAEDGIRDSSVTGVQTCALPIYGLANQPGAAQGAAHIPNRAAVGDLRGAWRSLSTIAGLHPRAGRKPGGLGSVSMEAARARAGQQSATDGDQRRLCGSSRRDRNDLSAAASSTLLRVASVE